MVRLRQLVKRQHAQHRRERRRQYGAFKGDRNEGRPTVEGLAADNDWIVDHFHPVLHEKAAQRADDPADQDDQRQTRAFESDRLRQFLDRKRRIPVDASIAGRISLARRRDQRARTIELGHYAIESGFGCRLH